MKYVERCIVRELVTQLAAANYRAVQVRGAHDCPRVAINPAADAAATIIDYADTYDDDLVVSFALAIAFTPEERNARASVLLVPGNDEDLISDYSAVGGAFTAAIERVNKEIGA